MGIAERKEREKIQRRNTIIDAAEEVFFREGIENASMEQVAKQAELSKGTLYLYFKSKNELYRAIIMRAFISLKRKIKDFIKKKENGFENVKTISKAYIEFASEHLGYFNAILHFQNDVFNSQNLNDTLVQPLEGGNAVIGVLVDAIEKGMEDQSILPNINSVETAFVLWSQITGLLQVIQRKMRIIKVHYKIYEDDLFATYFQLLENSLRNK